jgi:hypothetical protein
MQLVVLHSHDQSLALGGSLALPSSPRPLVPPKTPPPLGQPQRNPTKGLRSSPPPQFLLKVMDKYGMAEGVSDCFAYLEGSEEPGTSTYCMAQPI